MLSGHDSASWCPTASLENLQVRAALLRGIREYFYREQVLEVETPMLSPAATVDAHIDSFSTEFFHHGHRDEAQHLFLHTSPEFPMKRLLAAGSGDIYYLGRVFRNGDAGGRHNPEFTMLEWYRLGMDHHQLMQDVTRLLQSITSFKEVEKVTYQDLFERYFDLNPHRANLSQLQELVRKHIDAHLSGLTFNDCLDLLFSHVVEPKLGRSINGELSGVYVYDFPESMSALARVFENEAGDTVAARFELFIAGCEMANGYYELADSKEQERRFQQSQLERKSGGLPCYPYDKQLVEGLAHGFPDCAGVAMGIDRLLMTMVATDQIADVLAFDFQRA